MAFNDLVGGECGGANPLMKLTSHFTHDKSLRQEGLVSVLDRHQHSQLGHAATTEEGMVRPFMAHEPAALAAANSFHMQHLLSSMQADASMTADMSRAHGMAPLDMDARWREAQLSGAAAGPRMAGPLQHHPVAHSTKPEVSPQRGSAAAGWAPPPYLAHPGLRQALTSMPLQQQQHQQSWHSTVDREQWNAEFKAKEAADTATREDMESDLQRTARKLLSEMEQAPMANLKDTSFAEFVRSIGNGELSFDENGAAASTASQWTEDFLRSQHETDGEEVDTRANPAYWENLQKEWEQLAQEEPDSFPWLEDYEQDFGQKEYAFRKDNEFLDHSNPLEEGLKKLQEGDLASAILYFEAEVQARPESIQGWQYLGTTLANNEQEPEAIVALKRCLSLDSRCLTALMTLAVGLTNENYPLQACDTLCEWLKANPKYSHLVDASSAPPSVNPRASSLISQSQFMRAQELYLEAARLSPDPLDADVQVGLGVLFHLASEYDKAIDCFSAAVHAQPENALLWNKLGATLANSNRSAEAVDAYRQSLALSPGFVRCRYNLGISCMNLGAHREASEHFVTALDQQRQGHTPDGRRSTMSDNIWRTLRTCMVIEGGDRDILRLVDDFNLDGLMQAMAIHRIEPT